MKRGLLRHRGARWATGPAALLAALPLAIAPHGLGGAGDPGSASLPRATSKIQPALHVIPFPGTPDASPRSQIIFSSLRRSDLKSVLVTGSGSGLHAGTLIKLPYHAGTAFLPKRPFTPGETVAVQAILTSSRAGTASGDPGGMTLNFSFTVATSESATHSATDPTTSHRGKVGRNTAADARASTGQANVSFHSAPYLHPPPVLATHDPDRRSGDIFMTVMSMIRGRAQYGPMILDPQGRLLWFRHVTHGTPYNLQVQRYQGHRVLTWWQGGYLGPGKDVIVNQSYRTVAVLRGAEGYYPDLHELQITPQGTALIDSYSVVKANLSSVGGPVNGRVVDCIIQELDIRTGRLLWEWHTLGHVPFTASYASMSSTAPYDYFHLNSLQELPGGDLLISSKSTWALYKISRKTGKVIWTLGGKHSSFAMGPGTNFEWQHDARLNGHILTLFDDGAWPQEEPQSSAKILRIDQKKRTAVLLRRYTHSPPLLATMTGSMQILPNGNIFVGWGAAPDFSEYTPAGHQLFTGSFPYSSNSYRALRSPWFGRPATSPSVAASPGSGGRVTVYASWNGASGVAAWRVLGGSHPKHLRALGRWRRTGFETSMTLHSRARNFEAQALGAHGQVLGTSSVTPR